MGFSLADVDILNSGQLIYDADIIGDIFGRCVFFFFLSKSTNKK